MPALTDTERRVLGNLPVYRTQAAFDQIDEDRAEAERQRIGEVTGDPGYVLRDEERPKLYPRSFTIEELEGILEKDPNAIHGEGDGELIEGVLEDLEAVGFCKRAGGKWSMTPKGLTALMDDG